MIKNKNLYLKQVIVIFWCLWWLVALWTDIIGALAHIGLVKGSWAPDANFPFLVKSLQMYHVPISVCVILYVGIVFMSLLSCIFWINAALITPTRNYTKWFDRANLAFIVSISYWLIFFIMDQLIMNFDLEQNHMVQGGFELLCYLAIHLLPNE